MEKETLFAHMARPDIGLASAVNPDITRASTLLFEKAEDLYRSDIRSYGRHGSAVHDALSVAFSALEGGASTSLTPSGMSACALSILSQVKSGDHLLLTDSTYGPIRYFCENHLSQMNVETEMYDPRIGHNIDKLIRENTSVICLESPGSLTFEIQDIPAISEVAKTRNVRTIIDNTWSGGLSLNPLRMGIDISVHSATKYFGGHSDVLMGAVISRTYPIARQVAQTARCLGYASSADDAYQILRGFRSVVTRFNQQAETALELARWLSFQPKVLRVLHPALPEHPDHTLWARDFSGAASLFSIILKPCSEKALLAFMNALKLFGKGFSYGGYESLAIHCDPQLKRSVTPPFTGPIVRFACGLEHIDDLKDDIEQAFHDLR